MNKKICKNLTKILIILMIATLLGSQNIIVYGMSFGGEEFPPYTPPSSGGGGGGGGSSSSPSHSDAPNDDRSIICPHVTIRGFTGSVQEVIDSVNDTTFGKNTLGAEDTKTQPLNYDDVKVTVSKEDGSGAFTVNVGSDGTYSADLLSHWGGGTYNYTVTYTYPDVTVSDINNINSVNDAKKMQNKLRYNSQDYEHSTEKYTSTIIKDGKNGVAQVILALDCSASMDEKITVNVNENGKTVQKEMKKIDIEKQVAQNIINSLLSESKNIYIGLVVFTGECYRYVGLTNNTETLSKALKSNIEISKYYTNIVGALDKSYESFANNDKPEDANRYIFLLSDGLPTSDGDSSHALFAANPDDSALIAQNNRRLELIKDSTKHKITELENKGVKIYSVISQEGLDNKDKEMFSYIFENHNENNHVEKVDNISNVSKNIINEFKQFVTKDLQIINTRYSATTDTNHRSEQGKLNNEYFNYANTVNLQALDMSIEDATSVAKFKEYAKKLVENSSLTDTITVKSSITVVYDPPHNPSEWDVEIGKNDDGTPIYEHHKCTYTEVYYSGPEIYLKKLPIYSLTPAISITNMDVTASNGTKIFSESAPSENPTDLIASLDPTMLYGSAITLRYALNITNSSLYTDTEQIRMIVYLPKGFDYNDGTLSAIGIGENNISTDLSDKVNISMVATPRNITNVGRSHPDLFSTKLINAIKDGSQKAVIVNINLKDSGFELLQNGKIQVNFEASKLLGKLNVADAAYRGETEILTYKNNSAKRMQYKSTTKPSQTVVAIAGNLNENYKSAEELDFSESSNGGSIIPPTGKNKNMLKIYIPLITLAVLAITITKKRK